MKRSDEILEKLGKQEKTTVFKFKRFACEWDEALLRGWKQLKALFRKEK